MSKRISFLITALFLLFGSVILSLPKDAFAGVIQLPQTGQTTCYDTAGNQPVKKRGEYLMEFKFQYLRTGARYL